LSKAGYSYKHQYITLIKEIYADIYKNTTYILYQHINPN